MIRLNLLLIDDHRLFSESLSLVLSQYKEVKIFDVVNSEEEYLTLLQKQILTIYDVVLVDINLERVFSKDGFAIAKDLMKIDSTVKIILLTGYDLPVYQYEAKKLGIKAFVLKNSDILLLINVIRKVLAGEIYFSTDIVFIDELTEREKEILFHLAQGEKRNKLAQRLYISDRTLTNHIQNILDKLEVDSTIKAVIKAQKLGYIKW